MAHPLRTALGALAIATAVATLTLVQTAIDGLGVYARRSVARVFGSETFVIAQIASPGQAPRRELERKLRRNPPIRRSDVRYLEEHAAGRVLYAASAQKAADVTAGSRKLESAAVTGTGAYLPEIRELAIVRGRFFLPDEERRAAQVAVIGHEVAEKLFPAEDPLGRSFRLAGRSFTVIGIQDRLGTSGGVSLDRYVWIPLPAFERAFGAPATLQVSARPPDGRSTVELAEDRARATMRARHHLRPGEEDDFDVLTPEAARSFVLNLARRIGAVAPLLSGMALLAAIVVVANTTLVSVAQRTFDIGVRRAVGASRGQIVREVLAEAALVALSGGLAGALVASGLIAALAVPLKLELSVSPRTLLAALAASAAAGLLAGWYPARRAARIEVVSALRQE
ncbi:MAG TPA: ABC transporter permease [Thermoanaerobaculia bacterium]|nr:ABC transporter permease [Thermoanaerobaculia bacterium]